MTKFLSHKESSWYATRGEFVSSHLRYATLADLQGFLIDGGMSALSWLVIPANEQILVSWISRVRQNHTGSVFFTPFVQAVAH